MKKSVWKLLCCIIVFLFCFMLLEGRLVVKATETSSVDTMKVEIFGSYNQASAKDIFQMVNDFRTGEDAWYWDENNTQKIENLNLTPLVYDYDLQAIAEQRAAEIALSYSHTRPNGEDCFSAYSSSGQTYWKMAENIAAGQIYAKDVMEDWKEELDKYEGQGHRRNMLDSEVNAIGIASFTVDNKVFWVQEFARVENPNTTPSGNEENDDDTRYVLVEVDISDNSGTVLSNLRMSPSVMGLAPGNERRIPNVLADIVMEDSYLKEKRNVYIQDCQWESSNEEIVEIIDGSTGILMIQAPGPMGMAVLSTTVMGKTVSAKVYVTSDGELDMDQMEVIPIDEEYFPDEAFRQYISSYVDASEEGYLDTERIEITTEMMISDECGIISDLTGIEYFTNLNCLELDGHSIKSFDVSQNPTLEEVGFINCAQLKEVDFSTSS